MTVLELVLSLAAILAAAALFTNAVEIFGDRLHLGAGAVGSVLAAVGTALPETMIPIIAILGAVFAGRDPESAGEIGTGAILGAPFLLTTLAMLVVGVAAYAYRGRRKTRDRVDMNTKVTVADLGYFLVFFTLAAVAGILPLPYFAKVILAAVLVGAYGYYVYRTIREGGGGLEEVPDKLTLWPSRPAPTGAVVAQMLGALVVMALGARFFIEGVEHGSESLGIPAGLIALILAPLATELPEKFNSVIWLRDNKDTLAMGNITGAMVFQSTVPVSVGLLFTEWTLSRYALAGGVLALAGGALAYVALRRGRINAPFVVIWLALFAAFVAFVALG